MRITLPKVCVFDVDDTLYLERDYVQSGFQAAGDWIRAEFGVDDFADQCWSLFEQQARGNIFDLAIEQTDLQPQPGLVDRLVGIYRSHRPRIALLPDAKAALDHLQTCTQLALISDGPLRMQENKVRALGVGERVDLVLLTDRWGRENWKPCERSYLEIQNRFHANGNECLYVADNPTKDFVAPRRLGWQTIRVRRSRGLHAGLDSKPEAAADFELEDLQSVHELFQMQAA